MELAARGLRFNAQRAGDTGLPVVMLHGAVVGNLVTWLLGVTPLLARSHRVLLLDARSHGLSERCAHGHGAASQAQDVLALAELVFPGERVALVGHSFGGLVALAAAVAAPERVAALAMVEAPLPPTDGDALRRFLQQDPESLRAALPGGGLLGAGRRLRRFMEHTRFLLEQTDLPAALAAGYDLSDEDLRALPMPLLAVLGLQSPCFASAERLRAVGSVVSLDGGHFLPMEHPAAVGAALQHFLGGVAHG